MKYAKFNCTEKLSNTASNNAKWCLPLKKLFELLTCVTHWATYGHKTCITCQIHCPCIISKVVAFISSEGLENRLRNTEWLWHGEGGKRKSVRRECVELHTGWGVEAITGTKHSISWGMTWLLVEEERPCKWTQRGRKVGASEPYSKFCIFYKQKENSFYRNWKDQKCILCFKTGFLYVVLEFAL